jgi:hypothetical protein
LKALAGLSRALAAGALFLGAQAGTAGPITVRHPEGLVHGFLSLSTLDGRKLADGELIQTSRAGRVTSRLVFRFADGSLHDETVVFTQRGRFRMLHDHLVQRGPAFPHPVESEIDGTTGDVVVRFRTSDGKDERFAKRFALPGDLANGLVLTLLKNIPPEAARTTVSMLAGAPKPRLVTLVVAPAGEDAFTTGGMSRKAVRFVVHVEIGGVAGALAPLVGKQPPDTSVWILEGDAPAFVKSEGPLAAGADPWRIELVSPVWPK